MTNRAVVEGWQIPELAIDAVAAQEQQELARRERAYRGGLEPSFVKRRAISQRVIEKATRGRLGYSLRKFGLAFRKISAADLLVLL